MRISVVVLPTGPWRELRSRFVTAEAMGFAHAWTYDHLAWRDFRDDSWHGAVPLLAAAAEATSTVRLGTLVASPNFRHPVAFARELVTLDDVADGRITLGVGAGGTGWDASSLGQPALTPRQRHDRFAEFVTLTDLLLREGSATWRGEWYVADEARAVPGCVQRPRMPFAIAATGPRGMELVARLGDQWVTYGAPGDSSSPLWDAVRRQRARLESALLAAGRDPATVPTVVLSDVGSERPLSSWDAARRHVDEAREAGVDELVVHWPVGREPFDGDVHVLERLATLAPDL